MDATDRVDRVTYAPFLLVDMGERSELLLTDWEMLAKTRIFEEREGWLGNGYDWTSIAEVLVAERLPHLKNSLSFDPEAGTFVAAGPLPAVKSLAEQMVLVFHDDAQLRDLLSRAVLD